MSKEKDPIIMKRSDLEKYYLSVAPIKSLYDQGIINKTEFIKSETFLADKYCIKIGNLYRLNNLTKPSKRVIYSVTNEEVKDETKKDNQARSVTQVSKEN